MMNGYKKQLSRFIDFCLCLCFFPSGITIIPLLPIKGFHAIAEKFFLYIVSKGLSAKGDILEVGSYMGASSLLLAAGNHASRQKARVWLIEPSPQPSKDAFLDLFSSRGFNKEVVLIDKTSEGAGGEIAAKFRFIFIDGKHDYEYVKKDIRIWKERLAEGGIIAFHNISREGVARAVNELIQQSTAFIVQGVVADTLYASKGECRDTSLIFRFGKLNAVREKCINIAGGLRQST
jgi:predicted O-methyltransferase YrrM